ncbi:hypothetical protein BSP239C_00140 [Brevibacterium sp. 239c]|uniref:hypothetical protein n=1 Tax=Brevibacterium sp. 239c TaxID=1965356 RepID=UPI000C4A0F8E|nr:hypothetical protein [Brevibacterium sp. 239c]SMX67814.1 hypothetical protein BSP239C_00140 [Brevibacterium sp. 239c]
MPIEDGMRNAAENLDEAAGAAPTSKDARTEDHDEGEEAKRNESEASHDESDDA